MSAASLPQTSKPLLKLPSRATVVLSLAATAIGVLNQATGGIGLGQPWDALITSLTAFLAVLGIGPLSHAQLTNFVHISYRLSLALAAALGTLATSVTAMPLTTVWRAIIIGILTAVAGVLTGPQSA